jgi:hypothetical protein
MKLPLALLALTFAASCATADKPMEPRTRATCNSNPCLVKVTVRDCRDIRVEPERLDIPAGNRNNIVWELHQLPTMGFVFTRNGVEFKHGGGGGFSSPGGHNSIRYVWHNNNSGKGEHRYNVNLTQDMGRTICTLDPTIFNH